MADHARLRGRDNIGYRGFGFLSVNSVLTQPCTAAQLAHRGRAGHTDTRKQQTPPERGLLLLAKAEQPLPYCVPVVKS